MSSCRSGSVIGHPKRCAAAKMSRRTFPRFRMLGASSGRLRKFAIASRDSLGVLPSSLAAKIHSFGLNSEPRPSARNISSALSRFGTPGPIGSVSAIVEIHVVRGCTVLADLCVVLCTPSTQRFHEATERGCAHQDFSSATIGRAQWIILKVTLAPNAKMVGQSRLIMSRRSRRPASCFGISAA